MMWGPIQSYISADWHWYALAAVFGALIWVYSKRKTFIAWLEKRAQSFAEKYMRWNQPARFKLRIAIRLWWLRLAQWWQQEIKPKSITRFFTRPFLLVLVGLGIPALIWWLGALDTLTGLISNGASDGEVAKNATSAAKVATAESSEQNGYSLPQVVDWRAAIQPILLLIGLPSAFILWAFRDHNVQATLENQRKDINLKEFQEIQMRAAGALDEKLPETARQTMQVAAIHQLRPFLRGEYGAGFRRPAWELLKARLETSARECGMFAIGEWAERGGFPLDTYETPGERGKGMRQEIRTKIAAIRPGPVTLAERAVITEESHALFRTDLPMRAGRFGGTTFPNGMLLASLDLSEASFIGSMLWNAHLEGADLWNAHLEGAFLGDAHLEGAYLTGANLEGANLIGANLEGADLRGANLEGADLRGANLEGANLTSANLEGANLRGANLEGANLRGAIFNDKTILMDNWDSLTSEQRTRHHQKLRELGALHVDDTDLDDN